MGKSGMAHLTSVGTGSSCITSLLTTSMEEEQKE